MVLEKEELFLSLIRVILILIVNPETRASFAEHI